MFNYKFWLFVAWLFIGIVNLSSDKISKLSYGVAWSVVIVWALTNWMVSVMV